MIKTCYLKGRVKRALAILLTASMVLSADVAAVFAAENPDAAAADVTVVESVGSDAEEITDDNSYVDLDDIDADEADEEYITEDGEESIEIEESEGEEDIEAIAAEDEEIDDSDTFEYSEDEAVSDPVEDDASEGEEEVSTASQNHVGDGQEVELDAPKNAKAVLGKSNQITLSWAKVKKAKEYYIYSMKADGTEGELIARTKNTKYVISDKAANDEYRQTYAFKIMPYGKDKYGDEGLGAPKYVVAAPIITVVQRYDSGIYDGSADDDYFMTVQFTKIPGAKGYAIYRKRSSQKKFAQLNDEALVTDSNVNLKAGPDYKGNLIVARAGKTVSQNAYIDKEDVARNVYQNYKIRTAFDVTEGDEARTVYSADSTVKKGRATVRAPREATIKVENGVSVTLLWEDLKAANLIGRGDSYVIYGSCNGGKFKKLASIPTTSSSLKVIAPHNGTDYPAMGTVDYQAVAYTLKGLRSESDYVFKVAAVKSGIQGAFSAGTTLTGYTELSDVTGIQKKNSNFDSATLTFNYVPGALGYRIYYTYGMTAAEAENTAGWNKESAFDGYEDIKNTHSKKGIVTYTQKKLKNREFYGFKVLALGNEHKKKEENPQPSGDKIGDNLVVIETKIAAPTVTVEQSGDDLIFKWNKVKKADGYHIRYSVGLDTRTVTKYENKPSVTQYTIEGVKLGVPVVFEITTVCRDDIDSEEEKYGNTATKTAYLKPSKPSIYNIFFADDGGGQVIVVKSPGKSYIDKYKDEDTEWGYRILRKKKGDKDFELLNPFYRPAGGWNFKKDYLEIPDTERVTKGKEYEYQVYSVVRNPNFPATMESPVKSAKRAEKTYCEASEVKDLSIEVGVGETKDITFKCSPSAATMTEVENFYIAEGSKKSELKDAMEFDDDYSDKYQKPEKNYSNSYLKVTKGYFYAIKYARSMLSTKLTVEGKKAGTTYIMVELANGEEAYAKIKVVEKSSSNDDENLGVNGTVIVLDPGHGGKDSGTTYGNLSEKTLNLKISTYTKKYLENNGFKVYMTRSDDSFLEIADRVNYAAGKKAKAIISQHINSGGANGVECYYSVDGTGGNLASSMCKYTCSKTGMSNRGKKTRQSETTAGKDYYGIIRYAREHSMTGVIMENGFINGSSDYAYLNNSDNVKKIAEGNANGIYAHYK